MSLATQGVVGSILIDPACLPAIRPLVTSQDFPLAADQALFEAACRLADAGKPADVVTIISDARVHGTDVSDDYAAQLIQITPTAAHAAEYARQAHEDATRRRLANIGLQLSADCDDFQKRPQTILSEALAALEGVDVAPQTALKTSSDALTDFLTRLNAGRQSLFQQVTVGWTGCSAVGCSIRACTFWQRAPAVEKRHLA